MIFMQSKVNQFSYNNGYRILAALYTVNRIGYCGLNGYSAPVLIRLITKGAITAPHKHSVENSAPINN